MDFSIKKSNEADNISNSDVEPSGNSDSTDTGILFRIVDENGNDVQEDETGLLLYKGGTVCDDDFDNNAAITICTKMGFPSSKGRAFGFSFDLQRSLDIKLDDVQCIDDHEWSSCSYRESHNCNHNEDVFLICGEGKIFKCTDGQNFNCLKVLSEVVVATWIVHSNPF